MSPLPTIRIGGTSSGEGSGAPASAPGQTSKLPTIRIGASAGSSAPASNPGSTAKIPAAAVADIVDLEDPGAGAPETPAAATPAAETPAPAPAPEPAPAPAQEPTPTAEAPAPAPEPEPAPAPAPESAPTAEAPAPAPESAPTAEAPAPAPAPEPASAPTSEEPAPAPAPEPAPAAAPAPEPAPASAPEAPAPAPAPANGLRPGLKLPPRTGPIGKKRAPARPISGLKLPPKRPVGAAAGAAAATSPAAASPAAAPAGKPASPKPDPKKEPPKKEPPKKEPPKKDAGKKPADKKEEDKKDGGKKKRRFSPLRMLPNLVILLAAVFVTAGFRVKGLEGDAPRKPVQVQQAPRAQKAVAEELAEVSPSIRAVASRAAGLSFRIVHVAHVPEAPEPEPEEIAPEPVAEEPPPEEPKKKEIVKRVPADLFEDAILETVKLLRTKPWDEATRAAVNSFSDIAKKEKSRSSECFAVIAALRSAKTWDDLVADTLYEHPTKREIVVGNTKHVIVPTSTQSGAIVCKRYLKGQTLLNQTIYLADMSPKEKLRILRSEPPDTEKAALFSRAFLELVYGSPKTFRAFVEKHKKIEAMKAFYVAYELKRLDDRGGDEP